MSAADSECVYLCVCLLFFLLFRGRKTVPKAGPDNNRHLCGSAGGRHRVCCCILQNQVSPKTETAHSKNMAIHRISLLPCINKEIL